MRLRIIAGTLGGRWLNSPDTATTHPMSERLRGSLFNILGDITDLSLLDAFAGSGALSFEAISRGAKHVVAVERDRVAQNIIIENARALGIKDQLTPIKANVRSWSETSQQEKFDIILCDPPYHDLQLSTISLLCAHLKPKGLMVLSHSGRESAPTVNGVVVVDKRIYGDAALAFYRKSIA